jgi:hypothetical protein
MANFNHNRPHLRFVDNLRRVLSEADSRSRPDKESKIPATRKMKQILFTENELELCNGFLTAVVNYFECENDFLENFMKKPDKMGNKLKESEETLRRHIKALVTRYVRIELGNKKDGLLYKFWKQLEKGLATDGIITEMIIQEIKALEENIDEIFNPAASI